MGLIPSEIQFPCWALVASWVTPGRAETLCARQWKAYFWYLDGTRGFQYSLLCGHSVTNNVQA